jgi:hypothetical protein
MAATPTLLLSSPVDVMIEIPLPRLNRTKGVRLFYFVNVKVVFPARRAFHFPVTIP